MLKFCPQCGSKLTSDGKYCPYCGALIGLTKMADKSSSSVATAAQNSTSTLELQKNGFSWRELDWKWVVVSVILVFFVGSIISEIFPPFGSMLAGLVCGYIVGYGSPGETIYEAAVGIAIGILLSFIFIGWRGEEMGLVIGYIALYTVPSIAGAVIGEKQQKKKLMKKKPS
jgi:uncharacterized membrane protein